MTCPTAAFWSRWPRWRWRGGIGAQLDAAPAAIVPHAFWFGEDQARYIVTVAEAEAGLVLAKMKGAGMPCARIGTTGGDAIAIAGEAAVPVTALSTAFEAWLPAYMNAKLYTVIASAAKQSIQQLAGCRMDFFAALAMTVRELGAASHSTLFAPGICRNARVSAQLNATVSTNPIGAFTVAGRSVKSNSQY